MQSKPFRVINNTVQRPINQGSRFNLQWWLYVTLASIFPSSCIIYSLSLFPSLSLFFSLFKSWSPAKLFLSLMHQVVNSAYSTMIQVYQYTNAIAHLPLCLKWLIPVLHVLLHFNMGTFPEAMAGNTESKTGYQLFVYLPDHPCLATAAVTNLHHLSITNAGIIALSLDVTRALLQGNRECVYTSDDVLILYGKVDI